MKVLKFGGTSVGTVESLHNVKAIVEACPDRKIVVVSALGGITDMLIDTAKQAAADDISYMDRYTAMIERHIDVVMGAVPESRRAGTLGLVKNLLNELGNIYCGVTLLKELSKRSLDIIVSYGERISSIIVSNMLEDAVHFDARKFIKTRDNGYGVQVLDNDATHAAIAETIASDPTWHTAVIGGFIATDDKGDVTNLGRGGSDYTAAIMAAAMDAEQLEIWTDVDGFMTADPKVINDAYVIDHLTYSEAMELCNFGAKVVYPPTIYPVYHKNIPILVKNTFKPQERGTLISTQMHASHSEREITGISSINDTTLITISSFCMVGVIGVNTRIFSSLSRNGVSVFLVCQTASENNTTLAVRTADAELATKVLREEFAKELASGKFNEIIAESGLATIAIVGESMRNNTGLSGKLFNTMGTAGINVRAFVQGALEINISFVIDATQLPKALRAIHDSFCLKN
ncbi:MAG: aspartate kinase [Bacteroidales bacterium]|nr:aspartate kinase [Bacteroidales bacterium]